MRRAMLIAAILGVIGTGALAASPTLFKCKGKDAVTILDDGTLGKTPSTEVSQVDYWIIDTVTGIVRIQDGSQTRSTPPDELPPEQWHVVQRGTKSNDTVLIRLSLPSTSKGGVYVQEDLADAAMNLIRIRQWQNAPTVLFMRFALSTYTVGTCEPL